MYVFSTFVVLFVFMRFLFYRGYCILCICQEEKLFRRKAFCRIQRVYTVTRIWNTLFFGMFDSSKTIIHSIDNSSWSRNGDYPPTRLEAQLNTSRSLLVSIYL